MYDEYAPSRLVHLQKWFGGIIGRPLTDEGGIQPITPRLSPIEQESTHYIRPSKTLESHERIEIYNKQYWWRVVDCMQETFRLLVRLYGYETFNFEMAVPFLDKYPPSSWSLNHLGEGFADWLKGEGKQREASAASLDWAYQISFVKPHHPSIRETGGDPAEWMDARLALQPHFSLVESEYPFLKVRKGILKEKPPYWQEHALPKVEKAPTLYAIYRDRKNEIPHKELEQDEWRVLKAIAEGKTLGEASELLGEDKAESLAFWVQDWVLRDWLYGVA